MVSLGQVRTAVLGLPGSVEADHWGNPSFRIYGRIFATVPDPAHLNVMVDPFDVDAAVRDEPEACSPLLWGKGVRGVQVTLMKASPELVANLLEVAWRRKAPAGLSGASAEREASRRHRDGKRASHR